MLPDEALKSMKVMFATPCYISAVSMHYVTSIFDLTHHCNRFGLQCILHMHSESLITRSRNNMVRKFLSDETLTHLFWIDSDITFTPQSVCRLLLIDRDVTAGVYPMKNFNWPAAGLPAGTTRQQFEDRYTEYPFNPIGQGAERVSSLCRHRRLRRGRGGTDRFHVHQAECLPAHDGKISRAEIHARRTAGPSRGTSAPVVLRLHGRS